jgi:hypothetical protein
MLPCGVRLLKARQLKFIWSHMSAEFHIVAGVAGSASATFYMIFEDF